MRVVHAVTSGGSTLDILGVFEDRALAQAAVDDWRTRMAIYDDGWEIQELTVWDRLPARQDYFRAFATVDAAGVIVSEPQVFTDAIYEWSPRYRPTPDPGIYSRATGHTDLNISVWGPDRQKVERELAKLIAEAQAQRVPR